MATGAGWKLPAVPPPPKARVPPVPPLAPGALGSTYKAPGAAVGGLPPPPPPVPPPPLAPAAAPPVHFGLPPLSKFAPAPRRPPPAASAAVQSATAPGPTADGSSSVVVVVVKEEGLSSKGSSTSSSSSSSSELLSPESITGDIWPRIPWHLRRASADPKFIGPVVPSKARPWGRPPPATTTTAATATATAATPTGVATVLLGGGRVPQQKAMPRMPAKPLVLAKAPVLAKARPSMPVPRPSTGPKPVEPLYKVEVMPRARAQEPKAGHEVPKAWHQKPKPAWSAQPWSQQKSKGQKRIHWQAAKKEYKRSKASEDWDEFFDKFLRSVSNAGSAPGHRQAPSTVVFEEILSDKEPDAPGWDEDDEDEAWGTWKAPGDDEDDEDWGTWKAPGHLAIGDVSSGADIQTPGGSSASGVNAPGYLIGMLLQEELQGLAAPGSSASTVQQPEPAVEQQQEQIEAPLLPPSVPSEDLLPADVTVRSTQPTRRMSKKTKLA